jgi:hypothetical protein
VAFFNACPRPYLQEACSSLDASVNHRTEVIDLAGVPDVPESLPHSRVNEERFG